MRVGVQRHIWLIIAGFYLGLLPGLWRPAYANGGHVHLGGIFFLLLGGIVFIVGTGIIFYMLFRASPDEIDLEETRPEETRPEETREDPEHE